MSRPGLVVLGRALFSTWLLAAAACGDSGPGPPPDGGDIWDIDEDGVPTFVDVDYIELEKIGRISRFRSGEGHDYSDAFEHCRSMKHYFEPRPELDWSTVALFSPVAGQITRVEPESMGTKIEIQSQSYPAFRFVIFHVDLAAPLQVGDLLGAGQRLGNHIGTQTYSDIAVIVNDPTRQGRMVSYFETMSDGLFQAYVERGVHARADAIISRAERDAHPLTCVGDSFVDPGTLANWLELD